MRPFILCLMTIFCTTSATPFPQNDLGSSPLVALGGSATTDAENTETPGIGNPGTSGIGDTSISGIGNPNIFGTGYTNILGVGTDTQSNPVNSFSSSGYTPPLAMSPPEAEARPPCPRLTPYEWAKFRFAWDVLDIWQKSMGDCQTATNTSPPQCNSPPVTLDKAVANGGKGNPDGNGNCPTDNEDTVQLALARKRYEKLKGALLSCQDELDKLKSDNIFCKGPDISKVGS